MGLDGEMPPMFTVSFYKKKVSVGKEVKTILQGPLNTHFNGFHRLNIRIAKLHLIKTVFDVKTSIMLK